MGNFRNKILSRLFLFLIPFLGSSCQLQQVPQEDKAPLPELRSIVFIGFRPGLPSSQAPGPVRSPISGAVFSAESVPEEIADGLSESLFEKLRKSDGQKWIPPREASAAFSQLASSNPTLTDKEIFARIGKTLSAEGVLGGHVYRWREREGTDYAASRPASVAFDLYLMRAGDGAILWKTRFDKTQISLTENLLDIETFLRAKGRWMKAGELADLGLTEVVDSFPKGDKEKE
jgi:hypothetical protein